MLLFGGCRRFFGMCALTLGAGIVVVSVFPDGLIMFFVALLLIVCGVCCARKF